MKTLLHLIKYRISPEYRRAYDSKQKFLQIMQVNKAIIQDFK